MSCDPLGQQSNDGTTPLGPRGDKPRIRFVCEAVLLPVSSDDHILSLYVSSFDGTGSSFFFFLSPDEQGCRTASFFLNPVRNSPTVDQPSISRIPLYDE